MAYKRIIVLTSIWLSAISLHQVIAREVPKTQEKIRPSQVHPGFRALSNVSLDGSDNRIGHWAIYKSTGSDGYYGIEVTMGVYSLPEVTVEQTTSTLVWVMSGQNDQQNVIQAGWTVDPAFYGDSRARFFTYWTTDGYRTGCFNRRCEGYHYLNGAVISPGDVIDPVFLGKGPTYDITFRIFKDQTTGDWWLYYGQYDNISPVGYFPKTLFNGGLADKADAIHIGGYADYKKGSVGPPMGSGKRIGGDAARIGGIQYVGETGNLYLPNSPKDYADDQDCYQVTNFVFDKFRYGGPGGCAN